MAREYFSSAVVFLLAFISAGSRLASVKAQTGVTTARPPQTASDNTIFRVSSGSSIFGGGGLDGGEAASASDTSSQGVQGAVPYDMKSPANPNWNMFLEEVAKQTSRNLADLKQNGVHDPVVGAMWDIYVQTLSDGSALPSGVGGGGDAGGGAGSGLLDGPPMPGLYENQHGESLYGRMGPVTSGRLENNWYRPFFLTPENPEQAKSMISSFTTFDRPRQPTLPSLSFNSFSDAASSAFTDGGVKTNTFGSPGPKYSFGSTSSSSASQDTSGMGQMFSTFRRPPSPSQQTQYQQQQPSTNTRLFNSGSGSTSSQTNQLNPQQIQLLSSQLLGLLGKTIITSTANTRPTSSAINSFPSPPSSSSWSSSLQRPKPENQAALSHTNSFITNIVKAQSQPLFNFFQASRSGASATDNGPAGMFTSNFMPSPFSAAQPSLPSFLQIRQDFTNPAMNAYGNTNFNAGALREIGCKTLAELFDMDVPRPVDLHCSRLCPNLMPGAVNGKRFGQTCLCCPAHVSDHAIYSRSMQQ